MNIGYIQFAPKFGYIQHNVAQVREMMYETTADLIVLPELFNTGYLISDFKELKELGEKIPDGYTCKQLAAAAREWRCYIVAGILEEDNGLYYNSAVLIGEEGYIDHYRKIHLFDEEKVYFAPGDRPLRVYDIKKAKIGIMICFDWVFPEVIRSLALMGAQIICHPSNLVLPYCPKIMPSRSFENRVFAITANRVGTESADGKTLTYIGQSQITAPDGKIIKRAGQDNTTFDVVFINPKDADNKYITPNNHLWEDRRPKFYQTLTMNSEELKEIKPFDASTSLSLDKYDLI